MRTMRTCVQGGNGMSKRKMNELNAQRGIGERSNKRRVSQVWLTRFLRCISLFNQDVDRDAGDTHSTTQHKREKYTTIDLVRGELK